MKGAKFSEEHKKKRGEEQEAGEKTADVCQRHGVSSATFFVWKAKYGGRGRLGREAAEGARGGAKAKAAFFFFFFLKFKMKDSLLGRKW